MSLTKKTWIASLIASSTTMFAAPHNLNGALATGGSLPTVVSLQQARSQLHAPAYTAQQRQLVADQAYFVISNLYVHHDLKIKDFGPSADAVSRLKDIKARAAGLKDDDFQNALQLVFRDLHDNHTNYGAPLPLACSYVISPMSFRDIVENGKVKIVFQHLTRITKDLPGDHQKAKPLDELIAIDGKPAKEFMQGIMADGMGATTPAQIVYGLMTHTIRPLAALPVPANDTITYTLQDSTGKAYDIKTNLYAIVNEPNCVAQTKKEMDDANLPKRVRFLSGDNTVVRDYKRFAEPEEIAPFDNDPLSEVAKIQDVDTGSGKLTYMQLASFMPTSSSVESIIQRVKEELVARRDSSMGIIIDVRQNGGGAIKLAEEMTQLFTPSSIQTMPVTLLPNDLNMKMFLNSNGGAQNGWTQDITDAIRAHAPLTKPRVLTTPSEANRLGQVWFKPVVVLTDAACYSACDLFAAAMQDHAAATIVGAHPSTGAGGANVMDVRSFRSVFSSMGNNNPFKALPQGQSMRVSWRQTVRVGKNKGALIEDRGVIPDVVINYTRADMDDKALSKVFVSGALAELKKLIPKYRSTIALGSTLRMNNGANAHWTEQVSGVESLDILSDGKLVKSVRATSAKQALDIALDIKGNMESKRFDVVGKAGGKVAFRVVRELFWRGDELKVGNDDIKEDFSGAQMKYFKTFVAQGKPEDAWQTVQGVLRVGKGPKYNPSVVTEAFLPLDFSNTDLPAMFYFNTVMQTEDGMDIFSIMQRDTDTGEEKYLLTLDGTIDMKNQLMGFKIDTTKKHVEMVIEFESDENWNMAGPFVRALGIHMGDTNNIGPKPQI